MFIFRVPSAGGCELVTSKVVRRVRPEELAALERIDGYIESLEARLQAKRLERAELVKTAWAKAHVVRLSEVEALLPDAQSVA